jgi:hypothetical protein
VPLKQAWPVQPLPPQPPQTFELESIPSANPDLFELESGDAWSPLQSGDKKKKK